MKLDDDGKPDYRNTSAGNEWLRRMIEDIRSEADADRVIAEMHGKRAGSFPERRDRDPGEEG